VKRSAKDRHGKWSDGSRLHLRVKLLMVGAETLVVAAVTRLRGPVDGDDQSRADFLLPADPTAHLDVLRRGLRLPDDRHQREPIDVHTYLDDVRGETDIDSLLSPFPGAYLTWSCSIALESRLTAASM
jgi:hypothetical protein